MNCTDTHASSIKTASTVACPAGEAALVPVQDSGDGSYILGSAEGHSHCVLHTVLVAFNLRCAPSSCLLLSTAQDSIGSVTAQAALRSLTGGKKRSAGNHSRRSRQAQETPVSSPRGGPHTSRTSLDSHRSALCRFADIIAFKYHSSTIQALK